jgi:hypothetical protein
MIVLTVPHAVCIEKPGHYCDYMAPRAASALKGEFAGGAVAVFATKNRTEVDMNRPRGRDLPERRKVVPLKPVFVLDVHSFGPESEPEGYAGCDLVLMDIEPLQPSTLFVLGALRRDPLLGERVGFLYGSGDNDILAEMREEGIPSLLFEFSETKDPRPAAKAVARAVNNWLRR